jgi:benzoyl-CoA 2,3-dioxygenase component B
MFTFFTDRDGKFQLLALAESAFDPLSRTTRFMLTEEAHHMFVGETGVLRVVERTAQQMAEKKLETPEQVRAAGLIDLPTMQRYLNLWYSLSLDLFGGEISSNAATYFATGMKGRAKEDQFEEHKALEGVYPMDVVKDGKIAREDIPLRNAMNEVLRDSYVEDCQRGVDKWNRAIAAHGIPFQLTLPSRRFHRHIGIYAGLHFDPAGNALGQDQFDAKKSGWLPTDADKAYVQSLMQKPIFDPKQMANWIAAPKQGIKGRAVDFEYVRHEA